MQVAMGGRLDIHRKNEERKKFKDNRKNDERKKSKQSIILLKVKENGLASTTLPTKALPIIAFKGFQFSCPTIKKRKLLWKQVR